MKMIRRIIFFATLFTIGFPVFAAETSPVLHDLFRFDDVVEVSAHVTGDVYALGQDVVLRGPIDGDVLLVGGDIAIQDAVHGSVRAIGDTVRLEGTVGKNVSVVARTLTINSDARITGNLSFLGESIVIANTIEGATQIALFRAGETRIAKGAVMSGPVTLYASEAPIVDTSAMLRTPIERHDAFWRADTIGDVIFHRIISFFGLFLIGLVFVHLLPRPSLVIASIMNTKPWNQLLWGLGLLVLPPIVAILLAFTVIGIPLAMMLGALWMIVVYSARVFVGLTIGFMILSRLDRKRTIQSLVVVLLVGVLLLAVAESVPVIGPFVTIFATLWGLGGIMTLLRTLSIHQQKSA